jgi:hypothetical protein
MDLATYEHVTAFLTLQGETVDAAMASVISSLIASYSKRFEQELGRLVEQRERTEVYSLERGQTVLTLNAYPIVSVTDIRNDVLRVYGDDAVIPETDYFINAERGTIHFDYAPAHGNGAIQITYVGGMADNAVSTDGDLDFEIAYPDLSTALTLQVAYVFRRRNTLGSSGVNFQGGGSSWEGAVKLLPEVRATLDQHRRLFLL